MNKCISTCWLTINRDCNIRCKFCYAQNTSFSKDETMPFEMAKALIDISILNGVSSFFLLGGEPTIHPNFIEIVDYITSKRKNAIIVTNGITLHEVDFCHKLSKTTNNDLITIAISLKGANNKIYKELCGLSAYDKVLKAVDNCRSINIRVSFSYVITSENVGELEQTIDTLKKDGINETISFSYCHDIIKNGKFVILDKIHPIEIDSIFSEQYDSINKILESNMSLHQTLPICMCNKDVFTKMVDRRQITTSCQLIKRNSVIFDTDGGVLLCNHLNYCVGKYLNDFVDANSFFDFWNSRKIVDVYKKITTMPSHKCLNCKDKHICGGGCCIQWFASNFEAYNNYYLTKKQKT